MSIYEFNPEHAFLFATSQGIKAKIKGRELHFMDCPYCHGGGHKDKYSFSINLDTGQFKCLRASCGVTGNMLTLSRDFDFSLGNNVDEYYRPRKKYRSFKKPKEAIKPREPAVAYLESRGISEEIAKRYEITTLEDQETYWYFHFTILKEICVLSNTEKRILINLRIATRNGVRKAADRYCLE